MHQIVGPPVGGPFWFASRPLRRRLRPLQTHEPREQRVETGALAGMQVDAADLLDQALDRLELLEPQEERVLLHQLRGIEERTRMQRQNGPTHGTHTPVMPAVSA